MKFKRTPLNQAKKTQSGFTIIELMIATLVFSVILVVLAQAVTYFGNSYYRGVNASNTQNVARNIMDSIAQSIQFSAADPVAIPDPINPTTYCLGYTQLDFTLNQEIVSGGASHALWQTPNTNSGGCSATAPIATSKELLGNHMRLSNFAITSVDSSAQLWKVELTVTYGDDDLLNLTNPKSPVCLSQSGSQWCSVATLSEVVQKRLGVTQ